MSNETPKPGDYVTVDYVGTYMDGRAFDSTKDKGPLSFLLGDHKVMAAFEEGIIGMKIGETKKIEVSCSKAYGEWQEKLIQKVPRSVVENKARIFVGNVIGLHIPYTSKQYPARIIAFDSSNVTLDLNPPMAGKDVKFELTLLNIERDGKNLK